MMHKTKAILALAGLLFTAQAQAQVHFITLPEGFEPDVVSSDGSVAYGVLMEGAASYSLAEWTPQGGLQILGPSMPVLSFANRSRFIQSSDDGMTATLDVGDGNGVMERGGYFYRSATGLTPFQPIQHSDGVFSNHA